MSDEDDPTPHSDQQRDRKRKRARAKPRTGRKQIWLLIAQLARSVRLSQSKPDPLASNKLNSSAVSNDYKLTNRWVNAMLTNQQAERKGAVTHDWTWQEQASQYHAWVPGIRVSASEGEGV